jgi:hypothetical protein
MNADEHAEAADSRLADALARIERLEATVDWLKLEVRQLSHMSGCYIVPVTQFEGGAEIGDWNYDD